MTKAGCVHLCESGAALGPGRYAGVDLSQERASDLKSSLNRKHVKNTPPSCCDCKAGRRRVDDPRLASFQAKLSNVGHPSSHLVYDVRSYCGSLRGKAHLAEAVEESPNPAFVTRVRLHLSLDQSPGCRRRRGRVSPRWWHQTSTASGAGPGWPGSRLPHVARNRGPGRGILYDGCGSRGLSAPTAREKPPSSGLFPPPVWEAGVAILPLCRAALKSQSVHHSFLKAEPHTQASQCVLPGPRGPCLQASSLVLSPSLLLAPDCPSVLPAAVATCCERDAGFRHIPVFTRGQGRRAGNGIIRRGC